MRAETMTHRSADFLPFAAGAFAFFLVMLGATLPTPLYPLYEQDFGFSQLIITVIFAAYAAGVIVALIVAGPWSDEIGRKPLLLGGLALAGLSDVAFWFADGLPLILSGRFLSGLSAGIFTSAATVAVSELAPKGHERLGGIAATAANMGGLGTGPIVAGVIITLLPDPLRIPYVLHLGITVLAVAALWFLPEPGEPKDDPDLHLQRFALPQEVRGTFIPAAIGAFAGFMVCGFFTSVAPAVLHKMGHDGHIFVGIMSGLVFLSSCAGQIMVERIAPEHRLPYGVGVLMPAIAGIAASFALESLWLMIPSVIVAGIAHGIAFRGGLAALSEESPEGQAAAVTASYFLVVYVAISLPILSVGVLTPVLGLIPTSTGFAGLAAALCGVSLLLLLRRD